MYILNRAAIENLIEGVDLSSLIVKGFIAYSKGQVVVPPIGELTFKDPPGDVHIKYGYIKGDRYYVIKIASGFWENDKYGIPNGQGMMLLFNQKTGQPEALLHDEAILTDIRTAVAGQICASSMANEINCIGVIGTGVQARLQVEYLQSITQCRDIAVWGRNSDKVRKYKKDMEGKGFIVTIKSTVKDVCKVCNLILTTTASKDPIIFKEDLQPGTHITAVGADAVGKRELGDGVINLANTVAADSLVQCIERGEISYALSKNEIKKDQICELGHILSGKSVGRKNINHITIADLTGVAVQDVQIATAVFESYLEKRK
jgi:ornithine cyclodeaminase